MVDQAAPQNAGLQVRDAAKPFGMLDGAPPASSRPGGVAGHAIARWTEAYFPNIDPADSVSPAVVAQ
ncbi:hypothetical protein IU440_13835 [Nocardia cyriacigeorgica]|uniref:hypothetical protein n=1 Tax=Nocardia cyriacigeorgica TaxID=135487 RepID=UPI00189483BA|nr:hypothetical protein [Nocardia cyriacigeorgica]MBF6425769.1 hypothetical protein [Nocardia cyriacigeorgica]